MVIIKCLATPICASFPHSLPDEWPAFVKKKWGPYVAINPEVVLFHFSRTSVEAWINKVPGPLGRRAD
jgi:hypothetical protein